jgi:hypothetical protein
MMMAMMSFKLKNTQMDIAVRTNIKLCHDIYGPPLSSPLVKNIMIMT